MVAAKKIDDLDQESTYGKIFILLVSEQSKKIHSKEIALIHSGFIVKTSNTIDTMERILNEQKIDIVIMDYGFKKNRGLKAIKQAKNKSYNSKVKFIVTSTQNQTMIKENAYQNQCDLFLLEPMLLPSLIHEIRKLAKQEYRKSERIKCHIDFTVTNGQEVYKTVATNISLGGAYLLNKDNKINPQIGTEISLEFKLPNTSKIIKCLGIIAHHTDNGFGLKFKNISKQDKIEFNLFFKKI